MLVCVAGLEIRVAGRDDAAETAQILARAFYDDPVFGWFFPAEESRQQRLQRFFVTELHHESLRHGAVEVACVDGRVAGAAVWFPPGASLGTEASALPGYLRAFGSRLVIVSQYESVAVSGHPREEPHWYLNMIGVDPVRQGHGLGAALLRSRLRRCDQEGLPAYLESSKLENVPLYEHFGFQVTGALGLPEGAPVVNTMWRPGGLRDDAVESVPDRRLICVPDGCGGEYPGDGAHRVGERVESADAVFARGLKMPDHPVFREED
jgi:GNAT superfamily N-acetyltransferase